MIPEDNRDKERLAEAKFKEWLDGNNIPYWYIQQDIDSFSNALKRYMSKRPDFIILIPNVGFVLTDVEYKVPARKYNQFQINAKETYQYINLQKYFNLQVWYVFSNSDQHFNIWYWIPVSTVLEKKVYPKELNTKCEYLSVPLKEFITISENDNLGRLFSEIPKFF